MTDQPREGQCHWPIPDCHVWAFVHLEGGSLPRDGDPCRCGEAIWTVAGPDVGCPTCSATPDQACVTPDGTPRNDHKARGVASRRATVRPA